jgi:outer membrane cobalamin receptor
MRTSSLTRQSVVCRGFVFLTLMAPISAASADDRASGVVVDQSGRRLPRAFVRSGQRDAAEGVFTDERGRFDIGVAPGPECRVEASLSGFQTASAPCSADATRIVLPVAPVSETVVVSATRTETPSNLSGASISAFTEEQLTRRQTPLVADLLRSTPGTMVVRNGAPGAVTSLFVRGGESTYNKVLVDGIPVNEPGGTFFFNNLTTENLERIEIVRGAQSALFGSDAMASVVQLFTKRGVAQQPTGSFSIEGGTYDTVRTTAALSGRSRRLDYAVAGGRYSTDNRVPNSAFDNNMFSANVGAQVGDSATIRVIGRGEFGTNGAPGQTAFARPDLDAFAKRNDGMVGVVFDHQTTPTVRQRGLYSVAISHQQSTNLIADPPYRAQFEDHVAAFPSSDFLYDSRTHLQRHHASYQADVRLSNSATSGSQLLTVLADWDGERASLEDVRAGTTTEPSRDNAGVSVQHQAVWRRWVVTGSGRFEHNASFGNAAVPRGSVVFVAHEGSGGLGSTMLHAAAGLGIKEPTLLQSFSPSPFFRGNPDLEPERSRSVEAGVEQRIGSDRAKIAVTWFHNRFENLISTRTTNPATFEAQYFNIGLSRAQGAEFSGEAAPLHSLRVRAGYTLLDSEILESTSPFSPVLKAGQPLFRRPRHSGFADIAWVHGRLSANLAGVFIGQYIDSDFSSFQPPLLENPGYNTWDARVAYQLTSHIDALLAIDNVANVDYMEPLGYQALQRAVRAGARIGF